MPCRDRDLVQLLSDHVLPPVPRRASHPARTAVRIFPAHLPRPSPVHPEVVCLNPVIAFFPGGYGNINCFAHYGKGNGNECSQIASFGSWFSLLCQFPDCQDNGLWSVCVRSFPALSGLMMRLKKILSGQKDFVIIHHRLWPS